MATGISARLSPAEARRFGFTVGAAFLVLAAVVAWRGASLKAVPFIIIGGALITAALIIPAHLGPVYRGWMGLAAIMSRVTTPVFMGVVYFGIVTPTGVLRRLVRRNQLVRPRSAQTYWVTRKTGERQRTDMERQF